MIKICARDKKIGSSSFDIIVEENLPKESKVVGER